jgi:hypothetical protein
MIKKLLHRILAVFESVFLSVGRLWKKAVAAYGVLEPVRLSLIVVVLAALAFLLVPQGQDLLIGLAEDAGRGVKLLSVLGFFSALTYFCLTNWYWPRFLLNCDFPPTRGKDSFDHDVSYELRLQTPRVLGVLPACVIGLAFWVNRASDRGAYIILGLASFALAALLYLAFIARRRLLKAPLHTPKPAPFEHEVNGPKSAEPRSFTSVSDVWQNREAIVELSIFGIPPVVFFFLFLFAPVWTGQLLGSPAVLFIGLAGIACFGGVIVYFGHRYELPVLVLLTLLAIVSHFNNDNHEISSLPGRQAALDPLDKRLEDWHNYVQTKAPPGTKHPLFIVATEGGGIRAAYWTALVLSNLEDASRLEKRMTFSDHLFAISGVSGGSFGGAGFVALLADQNGTTFSDRTDAFMQNEFLAPLLGRLLFTEIPQRFLPFPVRKFDRAVAFEQAWEEAWRSKRVSNSNPKLFGESFTQLYRERIDHGVWLPGLFLNGTSVESGGRILTCSWDFSDADGSTFVNTIDGVREMEAPFAMSTAAHASARFTYFNPPGRYPDGTHVVDGGYFEDSGGETAHDILARVLRKMWSEDGWNDVDPQIVIIRNGLEIAKPEGNGKLPPDQRRRKSHALTELLVPLVTLWNTRTAHAELSLGQLEKQPILSATMNPHKTGASGVGEGKAKIQWAPIPIHEFDLIDSQTVVPLGWALSETAIGEMHTQITTHSEIQEARQAIINTLTFSPTVGPAK